MLSIIPILSIRSDRNIAAAYGKSTIFKILTYSQRIPRESDLHNNVSWRPLSICNSCTISIGTFITFINFDSTDAKHIYHHIVAFIMC